MNDGFRPMMTRLCPLLPAALASAAFVMIGCGKPPKITDNEAAMTAADALWTAVTSRRVDLLSQTGAQIQSLHEQSQLDDDAFRALQKIVTKARADDWTGAAKDLKWFIAGQHRP